MTQSVQSNSPSADEARTSDADKTALSGRRSIRASAPEKIIAFLAVVTALYFARDLIVPIVFAALLALLLRPGLRSLGRLGLSEPFGAFVLVSLSALVLIVAIVTLAGQAQNWLAQAPDTLRKVSAMIPTDWGPFSDLERTKAAVKDLAAPGDSERTMAVEVRSSDFAYAVLGVSSHFVGASVITFVVAYFLLALSSYLLKQAVESRIRFGEKRNIVQLVQNVEQGISRYLLTVTIINSGLGIATALLVWSLGIPNPALWGVMAGITNFVPHVGSWLCMVVLFLVGTVTHESFWYGSLVAGSYATLTSIECYFVTPIALKNSLHLSPLATILGILFFWWMWGVAGGLLTAPILAVIKITSDQFESLKFIRWFLCAQDAVAPSRPAPLATSPPATLPLMAGEEWT